MGAFAMWTPACGEDDRLKEQGFPTPPKADNSCVLKPDILLLTGIILPLHSRGTLSNIRHPEGPCPDIELVMDGQYPLASVH